jgi:hypothetical protein
MTVTLARWLDEHPAPKGLVLTRAAAQSDGPFRGVAGRIEIAPALPRIAGVFTTRSLWWVFVAASGTAVSLWMPVLAVPTFGAAISRRRAAMRRQLPRIVLEGARVTASSGDSAREFDLAAVTALAVRDAGPLEKSTSKDQLVELTTGGVRTHAWRGPRVQVAWLAALLGIAIAEAGGRA